VKRRIPLLRLISYKIAYRSTFLAPSMNGNNAEKPTPTAEPATEATHQPPAAELLSNDQFSQYLLRSKSEMFSVFRGLVERVSQVTMFFNEGKDMILTSIVSYDDSGIVLDLGASGEMNRKALEANKLFCVTQLDKVKVQFLLLGIKRIEVNGQPAFKEPLPETVLRLQRREYFRLTTPIARPLKCQITIPDVGVIEAQVADISGGGIGLMGIPLTVKVEPGMDFSNDAPFPTGTSKVNIATMKDGKVVRAAGDVTVPMVNKW